LAGSWAIVPFSAHKLGAHVIGAALERAKLAPERIDEVFMGNVLPAGQGQARRARPRAAPDCPDATGATTVNKVCGSGMKATMLAHDIINAGSAAIVLSGGMESMSNAPYLLAKARGGYRAGHDRIIDHMMMDGLEDAYETGRSMGDFRRGHRGGLSVHPQGPGRLRHGNADPRPQGGRGRRVQGRDRAGHAHRKGRSRASSPMTNIRSRWTLARFPD
jgi:hypothetical protein